MILWGMVGLYALILLVFGGLFTWRDYNTSLNEAEINATNYVNLLEEHAKRSLEAADLILLRLLDRVAIKGLEQVAQSPDDQKVLEEAALASPQTGTLYLIDAEGRLRLTTRGTPPGEPASFTNRDFFIAIASGAAEPFVSKSFREPCSGQPGFAIARRILRTDGSFAGVAVATIESEYFREFYRALSFSDNAAFGIYKHDGSILVRYPMVDADIGRTIPANAPLLQLVPTKPIGSFRAVSSYDALDRVVSYRKVENPAIILWVATTEEDALGQWRVRLARNGALALVSIVVLMALSRLAARGIRREEQTAAKMAALFELSPIGMVRTTLDGRFIEANQAFLHMLGLAPDDLGQIGRLDVTPEGYVQDDERQLAILRERGRYGPYEKEYIHKSGRHVPVSLNGALVADGKNEPYIWSIIEDITARRQAEEELLRHKNHLEELVQVRTQSLEMAVEQAQAANRAKTEILTNMSHELRTPLNAVIGFSETLQSGIFGQSPTPKFEEYISDIHDAGLHLLAVINDILDVSAIDAGKIELYEETVCVRDVVEASVRLIIPKAKKGEVKVVDEVPADLPHLKADERRLKQIVLNLLSNAVKFTPKGGTVRVSTRIVPEGQMKIIVADTGIGMDASGIAKALAPFGQVDSGLARSHEGSGLGLPLSKGLVELHGGTLVIDSEKGIGTTITVTFPSERVEVG